LPAIAPDLRDAYDLDLGGVGLLLAAGWLGTAVALLPWGLAADRIGERVALTAGLAGCGVLIGSIAAFDSFAAAIVLLMLAGASGASVQSASGRAVMGWFGPRERGLAFGVRQTAVMAGGVIGALALPALAKSGGVDAAFLFLGGFCLAGAAIGLAIVRDVPADEVAPEHVPWTLRDGRLWVLCGGSGFYVATQIVLFGFLVLFLHDERGLSVGAAALALAGAQAIGAVLRLAVGRWSDLLGSRIVPLQRIGLAVFATLLAAALLLGAPLAVLLPLLVLTTALSASWNGLSFAAAAELAGRARSGAAIGFQQTALSVVGVAVPPAFAVAVEATSWRLGFAAAALCPLVGWAMLGTLRERV
jgi:MFS family permease